MSTNDLALLSSLGRRGHFQRCRRRCPCTAGGILSAKSSKRDRSICQSLCRSHRVLFPRVLSCTSCEIKECPKTADRATLTRALQRGRVSRVSKEGPPEPSRTASSAIVGVEQPNAVQFDNPSLLTSADHNIVMKSFKIL